MACALLFTVVIMASPATLEMPEEEPAAVPEEEEMVAEADSVHPLPDTPPLISVTPPAPPVTENGVPAPREKAGVDK